MFGSVCVWFLILHPFCGVMRFPLELMSDSQRFYPRAPEYLLFSTPVGALWEWKHSVMTPNPPQKAKRLGQFPLHMEASWGVGEWIQGGCGLHVVPWGQIKARDSYLEAPPSLCSVLSAQTLIKDLLSGQVQTSSQGAMFSMLEKANKNQVDSGRMLFRFLEPSGKRR